MLEQTLAIIRNTFLESIRQPVMLVILIAATVLLILSNPLATFTMSDDQKMFIDIGVATVFLCGMLLAAFIATSVLTREIENKTALTVVSKPVPRPLFVLGKYIGVSLAMLVALVYMSSTFLLVELHTVLQTVRDPYHLPVLLFGTLAAVGGLGIGIWCNYFYNKPFPSTVVLSTSTLAVIAYIFALMFDVDFSWQDPAEGFRPELIQALAGVAMAILMLTAVAIAASARLGQVMTLCVVIGVFLLGLMSDALFGSRIHRIETTWQERAAKVTDDQLAEINTDFNVDQIRRWKRALLMEEAEGKRQLDALKLERDVEALRADLRGALDAEAAEAQITNLQRRGAEEADLTYQTRVREIDSTVDAIDRPLTADELTAEVELVRIIELTSGEWDATYQEQHRAYPPLETAMRRSGETTARNAYRAAYSVVPNFQFFLLTDAVTQDHVIPRSYMTRIAAYHICIILAALGLAVILFQRREVG